MQSRRHNGTAPICEELENYANGRNRVVVTGTGNEADKRHHYQGETRIQGDREMVELRVGEGVKGFQAEIWTDIPNVLAVSLVSPSGEMIQKVPIRQNSRNEYRFFLEKTTVIIDYRLLVERTNSELIILRFIDRRRESGRSVWSRFRALTDFFTSGFRSQNF